MPVSFPDATLDVPPTCDDLRVLLIDDDEDMPFLVQELLDASEGRGKWEVDSCPSIESGLEALRSGRFHVCLVDYRLGDEFGLDLIRDAQTRSMNVPMLMLTSEDDRSLDVAAMEAGASDFISKGDLEPQQLERRLRYAVDHARARSDLIRAARRDPLTGLHNRLSIEERIRNAQARSARSGQLIALCLLDLDGFKAVNDQLGHAAGDELLATVAQRLKKTVRPYDTVGRLGGDEFVLVLEELDSENQARLVADRVLEAINVPFQLGMSLPPVSASVGLALCRGTEQSADALMQMADAAMYSAKRAGKAQIAVFASCLAKPMDLPRTAAEFAVAAEHGTLDVVFQPQVALASRSVVGAEALARWKPDSFSPVDTTRFIAELERSSSISEFDLWMIEEAQKRVADLGPMRLSVNVSPLSLCTEKFALRVLERVQDPRRLSLEVTERETMDESDDAADTIDQLRQAGVRVLLDDFGVGHSSFLRLQKLSVDGLKIDRAFVAAAPDEPRDAAIIEAVALVARRTRMDLVAEGVESEAQDLALRALGIEYAQGYFYGRPMDVHALSALL